MIKAQVFFTILAIVLTFIGFLFYFSCINLSQKVIDYGEACQDKGRNCIIEFWLESDLFKPKLYYELDQFYSNYRSFVTTIPLYHQLNGAEIHPDDCQNTSRLSDLLSDLSVYKEFSKEDLTALPSDTRLSPCGLSPKYVFTDNFKLFSDSQRA